MGASILPGSSWPKFLVVISALGYAASVALWITVDSTPASLRVALMAVGFISAVAAGLVHPDTRGRLSRISGGLSVFRPVPLSTALLFGTMAVAVLLYGIGPRRPDIPWIAVLYAVGLTMARSAQLRMRELARGDGDVARARSAD